jgi:hypothetical protein
MILLFPNLDTLRLALTSGTVPPRVSLAPAAGGLDDWGRVWLRPSVAPARAVLAELRRLGVDTPRGGAPALADCCCWLQAFPLERAGERVGPPEGSTVLFDLPGDGWTGIIAEILRLGNDRQSYRYVRTAEGGRVLLRVVGPPYYTLLRAVDREDGAPGPVAYVEGGPRLWVQIGYTHPFAGRIEVPEGKLLLLQAPRCWTHLDDAPFRDVYEVLDFVLPGAPAAWSDGKLDHHLKVPLRLVPGDPAESDELWVLRDRPLEQLDELVGNADDGMLRGLSFAVAERDGQTVMVLRVRPTKGQPPRPVLDAVSFRSYQKLPNLFVPSGQMLHPPLGRHVVRKLLAEDPAVITWLYPHGDGTFSPETLPDEAFRPLGDWIDYVLDHDRQALQTWAEAAHFDFEPFICPEDDASKPKKESARARPRKTGQPDGATAEPDMVMPAKRPAGAEDVLPLEPLSDLPPAVPAEWSVLEQQLRELEEQFVGAGGDLDAPERRGLWPRMALLNAELGRSEDAALCWQNALWTHPQPDAAWAWHWFQAEAARYAASASSGARSWAAAASATAGQVAEGDAADLDCVLAQQEPPSAAIRALAAYVTWAAQQKPPAAVVRRLGPIRAFLEAHERVHLPARASWLAALALARLSGGDVLGLARARDRQLLRLYEAGLRPEQDLPAFLRFSGGAQAERAREFRDWVAVLSEKARDWVIRNRDPEEKRHRTEAYADLVFSYGLARLGEEEKARSLERRAEAGLGARDMVHSFLLQGFTYRINQAFRGEAHAGPLPPQQLAELAQMEPEGRSIVDRVRHYSQILEPEQRIDAYRAYASTDANKELGRELAVLPDVTDPRVVASRIGQLLKETAPIAVEERARILRAGLDAAPRVGEDFGLHLLSQVPATYDQLSSQTAPTDHLESRRTLLEKSLFVAAHFGLPEHVEVLVNRFRLLLEGYGSTHDFLGLDSVAAQCLRGLRNLGMRDQIEVLLGQIVEVLVRGLGMTSLPALLKALPEIVKPAENTVSQTQLQNASRKSYLSGLRAALQVAGTWQYYGDYDQARPVLDAARRVLLDGHLLDKRQSLVLDQILLARGYIASAFQGPPQVARQRARELLEQVRVHDSWVPTSHLKLSQLIVLEAIILGVLSDGAALGGDARRLLDEDEFLVRRRIHSDLRAAMAHAESA